MILKTNIVVKEVETRFEVEEHCVEDSGFTTTGPTALSFVLLYFDFRVDCCRFLASYHHHLRICPRIYVCSSHFRHCFVPADTYS